LNTNTPFFEWISWIFKKYQEIQLYVDRQGAFRIADIFQNEKGETILKIQVVGKAASFNCRPEEIVENDQLIEGFSRKDVREITRLATEKFKKPTPNYRIRIQDFSLALNKAIFKLSKSEKDKLLEKTAKEISDDTNLLDELNPKDAHRIGYITAKEELLQDKEENCSIKQEGNRET